MIIELEPPQTGSAEYAKSAAVVDSIAYGLIRNGDDKSRHRRRGGKCPRAVDDDVDIVWIYDLKFFGSSLPYLTLPTDSHLRND